MDTEVEAHGAAGASDGAQGRRRGGGQRWRLATGALGLAAVVVAALWLGLGRGRGAGVAAGPSQVVNQDAGMAGDHSSPTIVMSPADPKALVVAGRVDGPSLGTSVHVSGDGGQSWSSSELALPAAQTRAFDAQPAFDGKGTLYVLFSTLEGPGLVPSGLWLEGSTDGGKRFSEPVRVADRFAYQGRLAVDPKSGHIHVTWLQASQAVLGGVTPWSGRASPAQRGPGLGSPPNPILMATSRDGGATFPERAQVSDPARQRAGAATPAAAPNGDVFVLYQDYGSDVADFEGLPGGVHRGTFSLVVARSDNGGSSFSTAGVAESDVVPSERFLVFLPKFPSLAVDPRDGAVYVAWSDYRYGDSDVFVRRSSDRGETWSEPVRVDNHQDSPGEDQYLPELAVAPDGRVDVVFLDRADQPQGLPATVVLSTSVDDGNTWDAAAVASGVFDARGTTLGLASTSGAAYAVWADRDAGRGGSAEQDLAFAPVRVTPE